jgi:glycosyltransferase involved in cell wall biosynthesis
MEAQSQRLALIATDVSAIPELIRSGETGLLVPERDPDAMASAILILCRNPGRRQEFAEAGDQLLRKSFDARVWNDKLATKFGAGQQATDIEKVS